jgi:hypothetical protein
VCFEEGQKCKECFIRQYLVVSVILVYLYNSKPPMKKLLFFSGIFCSSLLSAQITITNADMPSAGSSYLMDDATAPTGLNLGDTGPNHTWDFSSLGVTGSGLDSFVSVSSTPFAYQFFFNNVFLYPDNKADFAAASEDLNLPSQLPVTISDVINYYKKPTSGYYNVGFGASISGIPTSVQYDPIDRIFEFPLSFGNQDSKDFRYLISIPTLGAYGQNKVRSNEVDGWGTLLMPNNASYQVLRVKSTIAGSDTIYIDAFGFGLNIPSIAYEYKWVAAGIGVPILQINATELTGTAVPSSVKYLHSEDQTGLMPYAEKNPFNVIFQNPASQQVLVSYNTLNDAPTIVSIIDMTGKTVLQNNCMVQKGNNKLIIDLDNLSAGIYQLVIQQGAYRAAEKLVVQP